MSREASTLRCCSWLWWRGCVFLLALPAPQSGAVIDRSDVEAARRPFKTGGRGRVGGWAGVRVGGLLPSFQAPQTTLAEMGATQWVLQET